MSRSLKTPDNSYPPLLSDPNFRDCLSLESGVVYDQHGYGWRNMESSLARRSSRERSAKTAVGKKFHLPTRHVETAHPIFTCEATKQPTIDSVRRRREEEIGTFLPESVSFPPTARPDPFDDVGDPAAVESRQEGRWGGGPKGVSRTGHSR